MIKRNRIKCRRCKSVVESKFTHDFKWCRCEKVAVDGGKDYLKRTGSLKENTYQELSEFFD